jgi:hypothetical protein
MKKASFLTVQYYRFPLGQWGRQGGWGMVPLWKVFLHVSLDKYPIQLLQTIGVSPMNCVAKHQLLEHVEDSHTVWNNSTTTAIHEALT